MLVQMQVSYPAEACGLIVGRWQGDLALGDSYHPCANQRQENRERRFLIDPLHYQAVEDRADAQGLSIVSIVHSHPDHPDLPSEFDRQHAWPGLSYIIIAVQGGRIAGYRSWRLREDRSGFDLESIIE
jgi:proteasome lid subunit RPN8/RPN11